MKRVFLLLILSTIAWHSQSQQAGNISVSLENKPLISLIEQIEGKTDLKFYYLPSWIDTVTINVNVEQVSVRSLLERSLEGTGINFYIAQNRIILTPGITLTELRDFFVDSSRSTVTTRFIEEKSASETGRKTSVINVGKQGSSSKGNATVSGYVREATSGEPLTGAVIHSKGSTNAVSSDAFGFYSITIPQGEITLIVELIGMNTITQPIRVMSDGKLDFTMDQSVTQLKEVIVESDAEANVIDVQMGVSKIDLRSMKNIPKILGENDMLKVATTLPGVKVVGEGASGVNVRGGHADQNLVIINEATIYNTSHFLGFFSVFNADAIRSFEMYKSGIPVQHGGRLSSTFELLMRDGNQKKIAGQGGIGPITSHLTLEAPLVKDKAAIMVGGRSTYSNWVLRALPESVVQNSRAAFYDGFGRITYSPNDKNTVYLSFYGSNDNFNLSTDTVFSYSNKLASVQWRHVFSPNIDGLLSVTRSEYTYHVDYTTLPQESFNLGFSIAESNFKWDFNYTRGKHKFTYGIQSKLYELNPGFVNKGSSESNIRTRSVEFEKGLESAVYLSDNFDINSTIALYAGIRYSLFSALGPKTMYAYTSGSARTENSIQDTLHFANNALIKNFHGPEYRVSMRFKLTDESSVKLSYNRTRQYIHMLSNTVSVSPTDTWKLSDPNIAPQVGDQLSAGYYKDFKGGVFEFSTELYHKWIKNILDYKTGASLLVNEHIEQAILQGNGKAYGIEFLVRKKSGKLTGWLGYSYSRTLIQFDGDIADERINNGKYFPANYDKPHDLSLITHYKITRRYSLSANFLYSTGRPITYPIAAYRFGNAYRINYSERNAFRIPDYIRADVGFNIEGNHKIKKLAHSYWSISIYNLFGRRNPYSVYFKIEDEKIKAYKLSIFGAPIPTITYHFKF